eukprot:c24796_g1_i1 orf=326-544(+)
MINEVHPVESHIRARCSTTLWLIFLITIKVMDSTSFYQNSFLQHWKQELLFYSTPPLGIIMVIKVCWRKMCA